MKALIVKLTTAIKLTRLTMAFGAVSDVWFVILLTRADTTYAGIADVRVYGMELVVALIAGAVVATGLFAYGASLNDVLDVRHDSAFSPDRPIPAGRIKVGQAIVVTVASLIITVVAAAPMGRLALWIMLLVAAAILFYNAAGRFIPAVGIVSIGLIHAAHMIIPNAHLSFTLPIWLVMTHAMGIAAGVHVLEDKRPRLGPRSVAGITIGWLFWSTLVIGYGALRGGIWPPETPLWTLFWPVTAMAGFVVVSVWKTSAVHGAAAAEKLKRYGAMWQALYGAAWLMALGLEVQAASLGAVAIAGFAVMTVIKEITGLSGRPVVYR
ncbi:MAG: UbiA family prenyltransferase [Planctomycetota bacterium]